MKKIASIILSVMMMLIIIIPSASAASERQFYEKWVDDTSWKLAKCYYNWNPTGCLGCAGINEEFISAYEYYESVYPNSQYLAQYTTLYKDVLHDKAIYDSLSEEQKHITAGGYQAPCSGHYGPVVGYINDDMLLYNFYCDDGSVVENVQVSTSVFGRVDNTRFDNIGFVFWNINQLNRDGQWEIIGYATTSVVGGDVVGFIENTSMASARYNSENPWAILETFDAV